MSSLRKLSAIYVAAASAYAIAIFLSHNPDEARIAHNAGTAAVQLGGQAAIALNDHVLKPGWTIAQVEAVSLSRQIAQAMRPAPVHVAQVRKPVEGTHRRTAVASAVTHERMEKPRIAGIAKPVLPGASAPTLRPQIHDRRAPAVIAPAPVEVARNAPSLSFKPQVDIELAPEAKHPAPPSDVAPVPPAASTPPSPAELARVSDRLRDSLTRDMIDNFELFLYVSKAETGPWAQRMYVFQKQGNGNLVLLYNWPVSTGREKVEYNNAGLKLPSFTPAGYYELDPKRLFAHYHSIQWDQPMPYSMFFNWVKNGSKTGLAIHGATGDDIGMLGMRASAGCVRLAPQNARVLFTLIRSQYKGLVPKFDFNPKTGTMSNDGILLHDAGGHLEMAEGYKVLVFIENFGGSNVVAALF